MIKQTLEYIAEMFGFREPDFIPLTEDPLARSTVLPIQSLMYTAGPQSQKHVFASVVRAKELAIHLRNQYGERWMEHVPEIRGESEEVNYELNQFIEHNVELSDPWVSMTPDNVPVVTNGYHTVCAYRNQGYKDIRVTIGQPHRKSSAELTLKPFSEITVYPSRANPIPIDIGYVSRTPGA